MDQRNEALIHDLLSGIDVDHIQPVAEKMTAIDSAVQRIEAILKWQAID